MIESFHVKNFKALRDVTLALTPMHVLIGPNDSGKTSILEALMALCRSVDNPVSNVFVGPWEGAQLVWRQDTNLSIEFEAQLSLKGESRGYRIVMQFAPNGRGPAYVQEAFTADVRSSWTNVFWSPHASRVYGSVTKQVPTQDPPIDDAFRVIYEALSGVQFYRWDARFLALPVAPDASRRFRMESNGFGLALCLDDILGYDRELFTQLEIKFREIFPQIRSIKLLPQPAYRTPHDDAKEVPMLAPADGKGLFFQFADSKHLVPASQMSDGTLLVLAYLAVLNLPEPPRVLLVEEPENGIHPSRLQSILRILRSLIEKHGQTQILMTTHSPYVLDMFKPEEVTLCQRGPDGSTSVTRLSESSEVQRQLNVFSLGEIWTGHDEALLARSGRDGKGASQ